MKAIHLCNWKGWNLAVPLSDLNGGLTVTGGRSHSGDPSLVELSPVNLESFDMCEQSSFLPFIVPFYCASPSVISCLS